jgi:hypothetical protein
VGRRKVTGRAENFGFALAEVGERGDDRWKTGRSKLGN